MFYMLKTENFLGKYRLMQTTLGFVISNCKNLQHCLMFFCLYFSFLSSRVEYGCIILSPSYNSAAFLLPRRNARDPPCFYVELSRTNVYVLPVVTTCRNYNHYRNAFDLFNYNVHQIKNLCLEL
jgi:hypothetical protein